MIIGIDKMSSKSLVIGNFYLIRSDKNTFFSLGLYLGKDIRNYYNFYVVLKLRYNLVNAQGIVKIIDLGSDELLSCYKEIIKNAMNNYNINYLVTFSSIPNNVCNNIDLGIDTNEFINKYKIKKNKDIHLVGKNTLDKNKLYVSVTLNYCIELDQKYDMYYSFYRYYYDYRDNVIVKSKETYYSIPKMLSLKDILSDTIIVELFKKDNKELYEWCLKILEN